MSVWPGWTRANAVALASVTALFVVGYVLVPRPVVQYTAWLLVFSIWMLWFVVTVASWLSAE